MHDEQSYDDYKSQKYLYKIFYEKYYDKVNTTTNDNNPLPQDNHSSLSQVNTHFPKDTEISALNFSWKKYSGYLWGIVSVIVLLCGLFLGLFLGSMLGSSNNTQTLRTYGQLPIYTKQIILIKGYILFPKMVTYSYANTGWHTVEQWLQGEYSVKSRHPVYIFGRGTKFISLEEIIQNKSQIKIVLNQMNSLELQQFWGIVPVNRYAYWKQQIMKSIRRSGVSLSQQQHYIQAL